MVVPYAEQSLWMSADIARSAAGHAELLGVPRPKLLASSGFSEDGLHTGDVVVSEQTLEAILTLVFQHTGLHTLQLACLADNVMLGIGLTGSLLSVAESFRDCLEIGIQYAPLTMNQVPMRIEDQDDSVLVTLNRLVRSPVLHRVITEATIANHQRSLHRCAGSTARFTTLELDYAAPEHAAAYRDAFGVTPRFGASRSAFTIERAQADCRSLHYVPSSRARLLAEADLLRAAKRDEGGMAAEVLRVLSRSPSSHHASMEDVAEALGMSTRSLRRKLTVEGTPYRVIAQRALLKSTELLLSDPSRSIKEVSNLLGFDSPSTFGRALQRAFGKSPSDMRQGLVDAEIERR